MCNLYFVYIFLNVFAPGAKKMRTQGPQKFTLALVISSMRETLKTDSSFKG